MKSPQKSITNTIFALVLSVLITASYAAEDDSPYALDYTRYTLDNGLTLLVHQDTKAPIVAVNVWYHVGSKNERPGRTGLAHLFEHLMFNGTENNDDDWFKAFDRVGATGLNGTTNQDRTNYFQVVPKNALEMTLWMESDRMGHLLGAVDQAKLDEQRDVVKNEKRQGENQPYGGVFSAILKSVFPEGHPYSWSPIGSMEDLDAASLEDIKDWFKEQYGAANATLVVAGDVEPDAVHELAKKYFGHIASGPPLTKHAKWIAKRSGTQKEVMYDRVPQARIYKIWNGPEWGSRSADELEIASRVLSSDKRSRLYNRLVYEEAVASDVSAFSFNSEIAGLFGIIATAIDADNVDYISQAIDEEVALFLEDGPTKKELTRIRNGLKAEVVRGLEAVGGFGGKSDVLARGEVFTGDPNTFVTSLNHQLNVSGKTIQETAQQWLSDGQYNLVVLPYESTESAPSAVDRSLGIPAAGAPPEVAFDRLERATLDNGLQIVLATRTAIPTVSMTLMVDGGFAADYLQTPGVANLTMNMLDEGAGNLDALEISTRLAELGTTLSTRAGLNTSTVSMNTLTDTLEESIELFATVALEPTFPEKELTRLKQLQSVAISQEQSSPFGIAYRALPKLIYGTDHPYSNPFSGNGSVESLEGLSKADLETYHTNWFSADNVRLIVTGDITMDELLPLAEEYFSAMPATSSLTLSISDSDVDDDANIFLIDRPGSQQSAIIAAKLLPKYGFDGELGLSLTNEVFGGSFNARLNMNLREDKGWAYGARSSIPSIKGQRPLLVTTSVQTDKTAPAMAEITMELDTITSSNPVTQAELERALDKSILTLPGRWETASAVAGDIRSMEIFGLSESYWDDYDENLRATTLDEVQALANTYLGTKDLIWVVVGDLAVIQSEIEAAELGRVRVVEAE